MVKQNNLYKTNNIENFNIPTGLIDPYNPVTFKKNYTYENFVPIDFGATVARKELKQVINNAAVQQQIVAEHKKQDLIAAEKQVKSDKLKKLQILIAEQRARSGELVKTSEQLQKEVTDLQSSLSDNDFT